MTGSDMCWSYLDIIHSFYAKCTLYFQYYLQNIDNISGFISKCSM
jgi:hypothetical protein